MASMHEHPFDTRFAVGQESPVRPEVKRGAAEV